MKTKTKILLRLDILVGCLLITFIMSTLYASSPTMHRAADSNGLRANILALHSYTGEVPYTAEMRISEDVNANNVVDVVSDIRDTRQENATIKAVVKNILKDDKGNGNNLKEKMQEIEKTIEKEILALKNELMQDATKREIIENKIALLKKLYIELRLTAIGEHNITFLAEKTNASESKKKRYALFKDTNMGEWYTESVSFVKELGIASGYKDSEGNETGEFRPANNVTVAEILKIALETVKKGTSEGEPHLYRFSHHWARGYLKKAEELGLSLIQADLDVDRPATRAEVIRLILEVAGIQPDIVTSTDFSDVSVSDPDASFIQYAKNIGLVTGDAYTKLFRPYDNINRAEVAVIIDRLVTLLGGKNSIVRQ